MKTIVYVAAVIVQDGREIKCATTEPIPDGSLVAPMSAIHKCVKRLAFGYSVTDRSVRVLSWSVAIEDRDDVPLYIFGN